MRSSTCALRPVAAWPLAAALLAAGLLLGHGHTDAVLLLAINLPGVVPPSVWAQVTTLGIGAGVMVIGAGLAPRGRYADPRLATALLWSVALGAIVTHGAKALTALPRPAAVFDGGQLHVIGHALTSHSGSMPSGHALAAAALATLWWVARAPAAQRLALAALAMLVAWSRVAVGAHWPSDVLVGAALGIATAITAWQLAARVGGGRRHPAATQVAVAALQAGAAIWLLSGGTEQPQALALRYALAAVGLAGALLRLAALVRAPRAARG